MNDPVYEPIQITPPEMVELWNSTCALAGLPKIIRLTKTRLNKIRLRIKEYDSNPTFWESLFQRIVHTPFLIGENKRGWRVNADFVFDNDTNIARILEGKYDESPNKDDTSLTACLRGAYEGMAAITRREQNSQKEVYRE